MRQKKRAAAVLLSAVMAFSAVSPAVPVWAASWQKNASGSYIGSDGSVLTGILSRGIDVSQWQQNINWSAVADDDIQFAMIGTRYNNAVDPYFDTNVRGAAAAGLRVGVYLYSYATTTAMAESDADFVLNLIKDYPISYPVVLDVEAQEMNGLTPSQIADIINAFCKKVETAGYYPMVYTNDYWISNKIDMTKVHYDVWIARYNSKPTYQGAALWQASNQGTVNGINGNVDINFTFKDLSSKLPANRWRLIGDKWYYYKNYVKQTGWINDGQSWYYLNADGTQFKGWLLLDNQYYYLLPTTGQMKTGWLKAEDAWYYLNSDGTMAKDWIQVDGTYYYLLNGAMAAGWTKLDGYWYYFNNEGKLMTGWMQLDGKFYYLHTDGRMVIGWQSDGTNKYYMDTVSGVMAVGWKQIDKSWYYFNQAGHMITGWLNDGGKYYYLNPADGKMIANGSFVVNNVNYTFNQSGVCLSETSAIDGGSAGSVYTPGTGGTVANGNYMGTPAAGNAQNGITTGNSGSGNATAGSAPGGSTTTATGATTAGSSQTNTGMSAGNYQTGGPGTSNSSSGSASTTAPNGNTTGSNNHYTNTGSMTGPGSANTNYNYSSGSSGTATPGSSGSSSSSSNLTEYQTGGPK